MYDQNNIVCKDIIEENWLEYLKFIKAERGKQKNLEEARRKEILKNFVDGDQNYQGTSTIGCVGADNAYYYPDLGQFWNWYIDNKVTV